MNGSKRHRRPVVRDHMVSNAVWPSESTRKRDLLRSGSKMMDPRASLAIGRTDGEQLSGTQAGDAVERDDRAARIGAGAMSVRCAVGTTTATSARR